MNAKRSIAIADTSGQFLQLQNQQLPIYSLTKPFIASLIFDAKVDIQRPISNWFDRSLVPRGDDISVAHLLNHTSGIRDYATLAAYTSAIEQQLPPWSDAVFAEHTLRQPLLFEPGEQWSYSNPGYWLLRNIAQRETGLSFEDLIRQRIAKPLGLTATYVAQGPFAEDLGGYPAEWVWHGTLISTAEDIVTFMSSSLISPLLTSLTRVPITHPKWVDPHYGYGLMVDPNIRYGHNGGGPGYSASCFHFLRRGLTGCVLMATPDEDAAMNMLIEEIDRL